MPCGGIHNTSSGGDELFLSGKNYSHAVELNRDKCKLEFKTNETNPFDMNETGFIASL